MGNTSRTSILLAIVAYNLVGAKAAPQKDYPANGNNDVLLYAAVMHRHGDRTPVQNYPTDPHIDFKYPRGWGELTNEGRRRLHKMGQYFKKRYVSLTTDAYDPQTLKLDSSDRDRCILSGLSFFSGYFMPPAKSDVWLENINWTPVPIHAKPFDHDNYLAMSQPCYEFSVLTENYYNSSEVIKDMCNQYQPLYDYVKKHAGINEHFGCGTSEDYFKLATIHDTLKVQKEQFNLSLPAWADMVYNHTVDEMLGKYILIELDDPSINRYRVGPFLDILLKDMEYNMNMDPQEAKRPKLHVFSAHDASIVTVTRALKIYNNILPPYAAALIFELYEGPEDYYVKVLYKNETDNEPYSLNIPECPDPCSLETFSDIATPLIPTNWEDECVKNAPKQEPVQPNYTICSPSSMPSPPSPPPMTIKSSDSGNMVAGDQITFQKPTFPPLFKQPSLPKLPTFNVSKTNGSRSLPPLPAFPSSPPTLPTVAGSTTSASTNNSCVSLDQLLNSMKMVEISARQYVIHESESELWHPTNNGPIIDLNPFGLL